MSYFYDSELDRKSSRGMIYENEELRLRTININAEVERGQSDIKRLRRENEHLRREIWTLRDECDRLNKRFKHKISQFEQGCSARCSGASAGCDGMHDGGCHSNSDDSDSCDLCHGDDGNYSDDCCQGGNCSQLDMVPPRVPEIRMGDENGANSESNSVAAAVAAPGVVAQNVHTGFDHLSVVSEETLSNCEAPASSQPSECLLGYTPETLRGSQSPLGSLMGPLTPLTPIEQVANQLNDLQAMVPPLSYFENVVLDHMGSNFDICSPTTARVVRHTNGWDKNLQSPFAQRKNSTTSSSSSPQTASTVRSPVLPPRYAAQTLTTFAATPAAPPVLNSHELPQVATSSNSDAGVDIETVAITTMPANTPTALNSPKHFFAPLKPRLKINTSLANKTLIPATVPVPPTTHAAGAANLTTHQNCDPPDIFVANALASPYQRQPMPACSSNAPPPPLPQRISSPQVSPRHGQRYVPQAHHRHHQHHQHAHQHQRASQQQQQQLNKQSYTQQATAAASAIVVADADAEALGAGAAAGAADTGIAAAVGGAGLVAASINTKHLQVSPPPSKAPKSPKLLKLPLQQRHTLSPPLLPPPPAPLALTRHLPPTSLALTNIIFTKINEPIYATAQKRCNNLISAPAVTQPLMTATLNESTTSKTTTTTSTVKPIDTAKALVAPRANMADSEVQTDSVNLETILNDIETISEDILAIQLEKCKTGGMRHAATTTQVNKPLQEEDKSKKPYRSEMNLLLQYDGTNPTITPAKMATATQTSLISDGSSGRCTRSLERDHTDSDSPHIPDPMEPFPANRTYIGFDQLNNAASMAPTTLAKPPLPPGQAAVTMSGMGLKTGTPLKATPPAPPTRMFPPPLSIRCAGVQRTTPTSSALQTPVEATPSLQTVIPGLSPNKSHLYTAIANAAAKRAQFRTTPPQLTSSLEVLDADAKEANVAERTASEAAAANEAAEASRKKARRVSIVCDTPTTPETVAISTPLRSQAQSTSAGLTTSTTTTTSTAPCIITNPSSGSCSDLASVLMNPALKNLKQTSQSTPNSPHSARRRCDSNTMTPTSADLLSPAGAAGTPHNHNGHHHHGSTSNIPAAACQRKSSQDSTRGELAAAAAIAARSRCSRRHSDTGTVASNAHRVSGTSGNSGHHHHHHHHHHQHSSSGFSNNPHHSHHSHQDSNHETGTSVSDRNSNSLASSRESSTSFSMRSSRRKISVSSHTGGKIPWCGCWGNGCL